ncbi:hypothetical protein NL676_021547 [Syzygium grande]|nr:hypothetical protein NL676_021547 [Syzygium grande]
MRPGSEPSIAPSPDEASDSAVSPASSVDRETGSVTRVVAIEGASIGVDVIFYSVEISAGARLGATTSTTLEAEEE